LDKISPEIELSISDPSRKNRPAPVLIHTYLFFLFKTILLLILLHLLFLVSLYPPLLLQGLNNLCNLFCRHHKKVLNWGDLSIKLRYPLKKKFMENKNILLIFYGIIYGSWGRDFPTSSWFIDKNHAGKRLC